MRTSKTWQITVNKVNRTGFGAVNLYALDREQAFEAWNR